MSLGSKNASFTTLAIIRIDPYLYIHLYDNKMSLQMASPEVFTHTASQDEAEDRSMAAAGLAGIMVRKTAVEPNGLVVLEVTVTDPASLRIYNERLRKNNAHPMSGSG